MSSGNSIASIISNHPVTELEEDRTCKRQACDGCTWRPTLIPGLPDDVVLRILVELPRSNWFNLRHVSRAWRNILEDPSFYQSRVALGLTEEWCYTETWHPESKLVSWFAFDSNQQRTWTALPSIPKERGWDPEIFGRASTSLRGELYVVGGKAGVSGPTLREMFIYSPFSHRWRKGKSMITARHSPLMFSISERKIYVMCGFDFRNNAIVTGECYDADTEEWTIVGNANYPELLCPSWYHVGWKEQWERFYFDYHIISYKTNEGKQVGRFYVPRDGAWRPRYHQDKVKALLRYSVGAVVNRNAVLLDWASGRLRYNYNHTEKAVGWATVPGMADVNWVTIFRSNPKSIGLGTKFVLVGRRLSIWLIETDPTLLEVENGDFIDSILAQNDTPDLEPLSCVTVVA